MLQARYAPYRLHFKEPGGTSRGVLTYKDTYFVQVWDSAQPARVGWGECALFRGLGSDDDPRYEAVLAQACRTIGEYEPAEFLSGLRAWSSLRFGFETALQSLAGWRDYPSPFASGRQSITINGLVWMGDSETMLRRMEEKLQAGFGCIKLKIGAIDFDAELRLLAAVRARFDRSQVELRVDANGAFTPQNALHKIERLARYDLHSIEQPLPAGHPAEMAQLCALSPVAVALDEELVACREVTPDYAARLLDEIHPHYIVLKPSLVGGLAGASCWMEAARERGIGWWITSALESNVGLEAIARYTASFTPLMPQGLGTGALYTNNIPSPLRLSGDRLTYDSQGAWHYPELAWR